MSLDKSDGYKPDLVGKRVKHNCGNPLCTMQGIVMEVVYDPTKSFRGEHSGWWAVVKFDPHEGIPLDFTLPIAISKIKVIEE